jgi:hypothetical protein
VAQYHLHFVDHRGGVYDAVVSEHSTDQAAVEEAYRLDIPSIGSGFDVLRERRIVHRHRRDSAGGISLM